MRLATFLAFILAAAYTVYAQQGSPVRNSQPKTEHQHQQTMLTGDMQKDMQTMNQLMLKHVGPSDAQYDARLIDMLIPHHEGAVMMAEDALKKSQRPEIKAMATKMIEEQKKEIEQLKKWRQAWYGRPNQSK
jgi:uncharacterized protein (DUF305 family)